MAEFQLSDTQLLQVEIDRLPKRINLHRKADLRRIDLCKRCRRIDENMMVGVELSCRFQLDFQELRRHRAVVGLPAPFFLVLLFFPIFKRLLLLLQTLLIRRFRNHFERVGLRDELAERVGFVVCHHHLQRVAIDEHRIAQPVSNRVEFFVGFHDESVLLIEVKSFDFRQLRVAVGKEKVDSVGIFSLGFQQMTLGLNLRECPQNDVVGQEMGVGNRQNALDVQRVAPDGVVSRVRLRRRHENVVVEGDFLVFL